MTKTYLCVVSPLSGKMVFNEHAIRYLKRSIELGVFSGKLDEDLPPVNWPEKSRNYKVIQVEVDGKSHIRFPEDCRESIHGFILLALVGAESVDELTYEGASTHNPLPELEGERYRVQGMGHAEIDIEEKQARFYGHSNDYQIGISSKNLEDIAKLEKEWEIK